MPSFAPRFKDFSFIPLLTYSVTATATTLTATPAMSAIASMPYQPPTLCPAAPFTAPLFISRKLFTLRMRWTAMQTCATTVTFNVHGALSPVHSIEASPRQATDKLIFRFSLFRSYFISHTLHYALIRACRMPLMMAGANEHTLKDFRQCHCIADALADARDMMLLGFITRRPP